MWWIYIPWVVGRRTSSESIICQHELAQSDDIKISNIKFEFLLISYWTNIFLSTCFVVCTILFAKWVALNEWPLRLGGEKCFYSTIKSNDFILWSHSSTKICLWRENQHFFNLFHLWKNMFIVVRTYRLYVMCEMTNSSTCWQIIICKAERVLNLVICFINPLLKIRY